MTYKYTTVLDIEMSNAILRKVRGTQCPRRQDEPLSPKIPAARKDEQNHVAKQLSNLVSIPA